HGRDDLVEHGGHAALLVPLITPVPALAALEACAIGIAGMLPVPGFFSVTAMAERVETPAVERVKLNAENTQEQLVDLVMLETLVHHAQHVLPVRRIEAGDEPANTLLLTLVVHPAPVRMRQHALIIKLQAVVANHGHAAH